MPKKPNTNPKAEEARARKEAAASDKKQKEAKAKEDARWADEGPTGKAAKKRAEDEKKRQEAAQKKAEIERLKLEEEKEMAALSKKGVKGPKSEVPKMTFAQLEQMREEDAKRKEELDKQRRKQAARVQEEAEYERLINVANTNRMEAQAEARGLDEAVSLLSATVLEEQKVLDKHPEKRLRAAYKAYEEAELARLKTESPGLTLTQYKEQIWKSWKKSPQNPLNQVGGR